MLLADAVGSYSASCREATDGAAPDGSAPLVSSNRRRFRRLLRAVLLFGSNHLARCSSFCLFALHTWLVGGVKNGDKAPPIIQSPAFVFFRVARDPRVKPHHSHTCSGQTMLTCPTHASTLAAIVAQRARSCAPNAHHLFARPLLDMSQAKSARWHPPPCHAIRTVPPTWPPSLTSRVYSPPAQIRPTCFVSSLLPSPRLPPPRCTLRRTSPMA